MFDVVKSAFNKIDKKSKKYLTIYLIINIIWIFLGMFFYNYLRFSYQNYSTSLVLLFFINLFFIVYFNAIGKAKLDKIDICLILLVIFGIISTIFSKNISVSLYGYWKRYEGMFQIFYYYSLLYLSSLVSDEKNKKLIINFILGFGLINSFVCFLQVFDVLKFIPINNRGVSLGQGLVSNSNFFGSYMDICIGLSIGLFLYNKDNIKKNILYLFLILIFYSSLLMSNALSGMVGLFIICLFIVIYFVYLFIKKKIVEIDIVKHVVLLISCLIISVVLTISNKTVMFNDVKRMVVETKEIAKGNVSDSYGTSRMYIWKNTLKIVPNHLLHGAGIDCFSFAFPDGGELFKISNNKIIRYSKAHNEYLQKLVTEGMFSVITYIGMLFIMFITSLKNIIKNNNNLFIPLFLAFIGYCVQAFFNISVIEVAPLFFIVCGLLYERNCKDKNDKNLIK